jgi:carbon-monoxide dehydrogenase large subunit
LIEDGGPALWASKFWASPTVTWSSGVHAAAVEVDAETGRITILRYVIAHDCGRQLHPVIVDGQIVGGFAQGLGVSLGELIVYGEDGQVLTTTLMDYVLPRADDVPPLTLDKMHTPSPRNPLGAKGLGEAGCIAIPPALVNAAVDALAPYGVTHLDMPLTAEKLWRALRG